MCFCPFAQGSQGRNECAAPLCQYISVTGALAGQAIGFALQEPFAGQLFQSLGKNRTRNAQIVTHRIEAFDAAKSLSQDQKCPSVSNCADARASAHSASGTGACSWALALCLSLVIEIAYLSLQFEPRLIA